MIDDFFKFLYTCRPHSIRIVTAVRFVQTCYTNTISCHIQVGETTHNNVNGPIVLDIKLGA